MELTKKKNGADHNEMPIAQCAHELFLWLFLFRLLFVTTIESKQYFIDHI